MTSRRLAHLLVVLPIAGLLSSCAMSAQDSPAPSDAPSLPTTIEAPGASPSLQTSAASGAIAAADGSFGVAGPSGWVNETARQPSTVLFLRSARPVGPIYPTFTVIKTTREEPPPLTELVEQGMIAQRQKGATVTKLAGGSVGGVPSGGYRIARKSGEVAVVQTQYYIVQGQNIYVTTATAAASDGARSTAVQSAILRSWSWGRPRPPAASTSTPTATPSASSTAG